MPQIPMPMVNKVLAEKSLAEFIRQAWHIVESRKPLIWNWHLDAICQHLEAVTNTYILKSGLHGQERNGFRYEADETLAAINYLWFNVPPRSMKSLSVGVFWPVWEWGPCNLPELRYLTMSYGQQLSTRDSLKRRRIMESSWYRQNWGDRFRITSDNNQKMRYENDHTGYMIATSLGGIGTGEGGDRIICLPYDQEVFTDYGSVPIGKIVDLELNFKVLSYDHEYECLRFNEIEKYEQNLGADIYEIEFDDSDILRCTGDHLIYIKNQNYIEGQDYLQADKLVKGMNCLQINRQLKIIKSIRKVDRAKLTYNLKIARDHNYFAQDVLVHNCDDAHNVNEVESDLKRETAISTWDDAMGTRIDDEDTGAYIGVMQRTHKKDLTGHLLEKVKTKSIKHFVHLCLPARYEKDHPHPTRTPLDFKDPRTREGEALDQRRWPVSKLNIREGRMTKWAISGQHQQRPNIRGGELIPVGQIIVVDSYNDRHIMKLVRYWDKAISLDKSASSTASVLMAFMTDDSPFGVIILDCIVGKWGSAKREQKIKQTAILDGVEVRVGVEQEGGSGGKESAENSLRKTLIGFNCFADHPTGAKDVRLEPFIAQCDHGNVAVLNRSWTKEYLDALEDCKIGSVTDEGDATSGAFNELSGLREKKKARVRVHAGRR